MYLAGTYTLHRRIAIFLIVSKPALLLRDGAKMHLTMAPLRRVIGARHATYQLKNSLGSMRLLPNVPNEI